MTDIFYKTITSWLLPKGYVEIYNNHPSSKEREFHFIKDKIRVCCVNGIGEAYFYLHADIMKQPYPLLVLKSMRYEILTDELDELHKYFKKYVEILERKPEWA
jgi:hypothetical protein